MSDIEVRHANTTTEVRDADGRITETVKTFNLGTWEQWQVQRGLEMLKDDRSDVAPDAHEAMAYFAWLIGSCPDVEITITAKYES